MPHQPALKVRLPITRFSLDQEGEGQVCAIPYGSTAINPVIAFKTWQEKSKRISGPIFVRVTKGRRLSVQALSSSSVSFILKRLVVECQLPHADTYSAHSLPRGFATSASQKGACLTSIMRHGCWYAERAALGCIDDAGNGLRVMRQWCCWVTMSSSNEY